MRTLNDAAEFEFGSDRQDQRDAGHIILRAAFAAAVMFWNELAFLHSMEQEDFRRESRLTGIPRALSAELNRIATTLAREDMYGPALASRFFHRDILDHSRYADYDRNTGDRFHELVTIVASLNTRGRTVELYAPSN